MERISASYAPIVDVVAEPLLRLLPRVPGQLAHILLTVQRFSNAQTFISL